VFCASIRSIPAVLVGGEAVVATTWSWGGVATALAPSVTVDTRAPSRRTVLDGALAPSMTTIEVVPGAIVGPEFHRAVPVATARERDESRLVFAPGPGRVGTRCDIGQCVRRGEILANVGRVEITAPVDGVLKGVPARGARVVTGDVVAEVDPSLSPQHCFRIDPDAAAVATALSAALGEERLDLRTAPCLRPAGGGDARSRIESR
jgi:hypothetical protein